MFAGVLVGKARRMLLVPKFGNSVGSAFDFPKRTVYKPMLFVNLCDRLHLFAGKIGRGGCQIFLLSLGIG